MLKNKKIVFLLLLSACAPAKKPETLISLWEKTQPVANHLDRKFASNSKIVCMKDAFTVEKVKEDIQEYEVKFSAGTQVYGRWKHLNLSTLPIPQANFLKIYGNMLGDLKDSDSIDYSACKDVPCIYNKIYDKENHVAGYVHYLWYLKFGHMLSADNKTPDQFSKQAGLYRGVNFPLSAYLWNDDELFGIWRLTKMLRVPHTVLKDLKETQRIPRGSVFENMVNEKGEVLADYSGACGLASSSGWIILNDGCLAVDTLGWAFTHEMSHHVDSAEGKKNGKSFYRSGEDDYVDMAGFKLNEYEAKGQATGSVTFVREFTARTNTSIIPAGTIIKTSENIKFKTVGTGYLTDKPIDVDVKAVEGGPLSNIGALKLTIIESPLDNTTIQVTNPKPMTGGTSKITSYREWAHKPDIKLPSSYAGTNPTENFAESLALFRHAGTATKKAMTETHYKFVSENYYQSRNFEIENLYDSWLEARLVGITQATFKAVMNCNKKNLPDISSFFSRADFTGALPPSLMNCFGAQAQAIQDDLTAQVAMVEPEACKSFDGWGNTMGTWSLKVKQKQAALFNQHLKALDRDKTYLSRVQMYQKYIENKEAARSTYFSCAETPNKEQCYALEIPKRALSYANSLNLASSELKEFTDMYVAYYPFQSVHQENLVFYSSFVSSHLEIVRQEGAVLWESCSKPNQSDIDPPKGLDFMLSDGYLISSFYNCLNKGMPDSVHAITRSMTVNGFKSNNPKEELMLAQEIKPQLAVYLKDVYQKEKVKETKAALLVDDQKFRIRQRLVGDFSWVKNVVDLTQIQTDCKTEALKQLDFKAYYHTKRELFAKQADAACFGIETSGEFNKWLDGSKGKFAEETDTKLEQKIMELGVAKAKTCIQKFPVDSNLNRIRYKKEREACLVDPWPEMEDEVLKVMEQDPYVKKFQVSQAVLKVKLETNRRRLQLRLFKENNF